MSRLLIANKARNAALSAADHLDASELTSDDLIAALRAVQAAAEHLRDAIAAAPSVPSSQQEPA